MLKIILTSLAIFGLVAVLGAAWAKHRGYCTGGDRWQQVTERVSRKLDLNDEQRTKLGAFAETLRELRGAWGERRTSMGSELQGLLAAPSLDRGRAGSLLDGLHGAIAQQQRELVDGFATFSDSLQPEQRTRLAELIGERMEFRRGPPRWNH